MSHERGLRERTDANKGDRERTAMTGYINERQRIVMTWPSKRK